MKTKIMLVVGFVITSLNVSGQTNNEEVDFYQAIFGMEKKAYIAQFIEMETETAMIFWDIYNKYELERKDLGKNRISLLQSYADKYETLTADDTDELIKDVMSQRKALDKTIEKYYKQMKKSVGSKEAAQFYQVENYILRAIRMSILERIPFFKN